MFWCHGEGLPVSVLGHEGNAMSAIICAVLLIAVILLIIRFGPKGSR